MPAAAARVAACSNSSSPVHWMGSWQGSLAFQTPPCFNHSPLLLTEIDLAVLVTLLLAAHYSRHIIG